MTESGASYALKVYYRRYPELLHSGPWSEAALGTYVSAQGISDMPHMAMACPEDGWIISEFVDSEFKSSSPDGPTRESLGLKVLDPQLDADNELCGSNGEAYRVDYGHIDSPEGRGDGPPAVRSHLEKYIERRAYFNSEEFINLFEQYPEDRGYLLGQLWIVEPDERLKTLRVMQGFDGSEHFPLQDYICAKLLPEDAIPELFDLLMSSENSRQRAQAVFDVRNLPSEQSARLIQAWETAPEFRPLRIFMGLEAF